MTDSSMTYEEAMQELQRAKEEVRIFAQHEGFAELTNATFRDWGTALRIQGNSEGDVWVTASPDEDAPELSDEEAARLIMERGEQFGTLEGARLFHLERASDIDRVMVEMGCEQS